MKASSDDPSTAVAWLAPRVLPAGEPQLDRGGLDVAGAVAVTAGIGLATFALVEANDAGWVSVQTLGLLAAALALLAVFALIERRNPNPLVPLRIFGDRRFTPDGSVLVDVICPSVVTGLGPGCALGS